MKSPDYLKVGDRVGLVAPSRSVQAAEMDPFIRQLRSWGLEVVCGEHLYEVYHQFGGKDSARTRDLQEMLDDPGIRAVFCARGGYGILRIIDRVCWDGLRKRPKWIVGFSDITVLHGHVQRHCGLQTIHGPMPYNFFHTDLSPESVESLRQALFGGELTCRWDSHPLSRPGKASGVLTGGNLSMLYALVASPSEYQYENTILFLEDLDEYLYHVDRMILSLKRAGRLSRLSGMIVGGMTEMKDNRVPMGFDAYEIIAAAVEDFDFPVAFGFPAGHIPDNRSLLLGCELDLSVGEVQEIFFNRTGK